MLHARRIYRDDYDLLHEGMQRLAAAREWEIIERPNEAEPGPPDPRLVTLADLGLERLRPIVEPVETMACETCANRNNPAGSGPCVNCDLTVDGPESNYSAETDEPLDAFAARSAAGLDEDDEDDET
jgi:hypothetical protein